MTNKKRAFSFSTIRTDRRRYTRRPGRARRGTVHGVASPLGREHVSAQLNSRLVVGGKKKQMPYGFSILTPPGRRGNRSAISSFERC